MEMQSMMARPVIGVDVGGTTIGIGRIESQKIVRQHSNKINASGTLEQTVNEIIESIQPVFDSNIAAIGIGVPSVVDNVAGIVYNAQNIPSWKEVHLKAILEDHFQKPVFLNNDANCFAIGEKYFNKGRPFSNFVGVTLGTGFGTGIIINNSLYSGVNCGAGEFCSIPYLDKTIEDYCSEQFFAKMHNSTGLEMSQKAGNSDKDALAVFDSFGHHLGEIIKIILFALSPEAIILGGSISQSNSYFKEAMWEAVRSFPYPKALGSLVIEVADHPHIGILGAAALCFDNMEMGG